VVIDPVAWLRSRQGAANMAGRGMGAATQGGGCVAKGAKNRMIKPTSKTTGPILMAKGGYVEPRKKMAMGKKCAHRSQG
jgi:hypothetical protein